MRKLGAIKAQATGRHKTIAGEFYDYYNMFRKLPKKFASFPSPGKFLMQDKEIGRHAVLLPLGCSHAQVGHHQGSSNWTTQNYCW